MTGTETGTGGSQVGSYGTCLVLAQLGVNG